MLTWYLIGNLCFDILKNMENMEGDSGMDEIGLVTPTPDPWLPVAWQAAMSAMIPWQRQKWGRHH